MQLPEPFFTHQAPMPRPQTPTQNVQVLMGPPRGLSHRGQANPYKKPRPGCSSPGAAPRVSFPFQQHSLCRSPRSGQNENHSHLSLKLPRPRT